MKTTLTRTLIAGVLVASFVIIACQKSKISDFPVSKSESTETTNAYKPGILLENGSILTGGVTLTALQQVNVNQSFNITAAVDCGRISIERGFILAGDGITKIYKDLSCETANLEWELVASFQCYSADASWDGSFAEPGSYVFRTKHNAADGNCDGRGGQDRTGECTFNGNEFYCFIIQAVNSCTTSFTGEAFDCSTDREAEYTFTSEEAMTGFKIQGGLTNFTGADAVVTVTGGSNITQSQWTVDGSSNRVIKVEGDIDACETITIHITWKSTNSGGIITGSWSVSANGGEVAPDVAGLTCGN
jgi:hypothetical protein